MTRLCTLTLSAAFGIAAMACGSNGSSTGKSAIDIAPTSNAVSGWTVDVAHNQNGNQTPMTAFMCDQDAKDPKDPKLISMLIDGGASNYCVGSNRPKLFVWQNYINATLSAAPPPDGASIVLYVIQYPSADQASGVYSAVLSLSDYDGKKGTDQDWAATSPVIGTESRIQDTNSQWWLNFHQGEYYIEVKLDPSAGPGPDFVAHDVDLKNEAIRFAQAVASKI